MLFVVIAVLCLTAQAGIKDSRLLRVSEVSSLTLIRLLTLNSIILTAAAVGTCSRFGSRMVRLQGQYWTDEFQSGATFKVCDTLPENLHEGISWPRRRRAKIRIVQGDRCANQQTQREIQEGRSVLGDGSKSVHWLISERIRWLKLYLLSQTQHVYIYQVCYSFWCPNILETNFIENRIKISDNQRVNLRHILISNPANPSSNVLESRR